MSKLPIILQYISFYYNSNISLNLMPKVIDKYVLEDKIGNGQFGQVFKGKHQETLQAVAVKSIKRDMIKGKFYQLLENEIKVLKTCDNPYIIKLYALKKTPHNYYLMLQYCNGGDMLAKIKKEGTIPEQQVIKYLCQILNAFQTLVKHKIMHRDFKLANILLHDGNIKIADFGFAKLLSEEDYATTMLGSPLNMAPQVLGGGKYNNKADIWSIGACIYQMIFGKPPYIASNMVDLVKLIKSKPLVIPNKPKISDEMRDIIKGMLTADIKKRMDWNVLFNHPITSYFSKKRKQEAELQLIEDESLMINTSKCYLKNNLVLQNINQLKQKSEVNDYLVDIIRKGKKSVQNVEQIQKEQAKKLINHKNMNKINKHNSKKLLHYRNIYAFLASIADLIINRTEYQNYEIAAYVIIRKILSMIQWLLKIMQSTQCPLEGIQHWKQYVQEADFKEINDYIKKQLEVFYVFKESLEPMIKKQSLQGAYDADIKQFIGGNYKDMIYAKYLKKFIFNVLSKITVSTLQKKTLQASKLDWKLVYYGLKIIKVQETFGKDSSQFDFVHFYQQFQKIQQQQMLLQIQQIIKQQK